MKEKLERFDSITIQFNTSENEPLFEQEPNQLNINNELNELQIRGKERIRGIDIFEPLDNEELSDEENIESIEKNDDYITTMTNLCGNMYNSSHNIETYNDYPYFRVQNTCKFVPKLDKESEILSKKQLRELHSNIPYYQQYKDLKLLYSMSVDGTALKTFFEKSEGIQNSILVVKDDSENIFGAYISDYLQIKYSQFYGTAETFIFTFFDTERIHCFPATRINDYYIFSDDKRIAFGCSDEAFSLSLDNDFWGGYTAKTKTYNNLPLSKKEKFIVVKVELWTFQI